MAEETTQRRTLDISEGAKMALPDVGSPDLADYVLSNWAVQDDHYRGLYQLWVKALLYIIGKHHVTWDARQSVYLPITDVPQWRQQPVTNLVFSVFRALRAKLSKNKPTLEVVPPSNDSEDIASSHLAEAILQFLWRHLKSPQKVMRAIDWFVSCGNVFLNVDWDETAGRLKPRTVLVEVPDPNWAPDPMVPGELPATMDRECPCDEQGEPFRRKSEGPQDLAPDGGEPYDFDREPDVDPEGEIELTINDPFSTRFNPDAPSAEEAEEWFTAKLWPKSKVAEFFEIEEAELDDLVIGESDDMMEESADLISRVTAAAPDPFATPQSGSIGTDQSEAIGDRILVIKWYRKPDAARGWPNGRHIIVAGRKKVWPKEGDATYSGGEAPLPHGFWPPDVPLVDTPVPGQPQGLGVIGQIVPLNEQLNYLDGKIAEYHVTMAMGGVWFVGPGDKNIVITSEPGQVKVSKEMGAKGRAGAPFQAQMNPLPDAVYREREVILQKIKMIAGLSDVDLSQKPEGVSAGRAFLVLQEASDSAIMPSLLALETALEEVGRRKLIIAREKYTEERTIQVRGDRGKYEFRSFTNADLRDGMDVRVQVGSMFPWSKSAQWDTKLSVIQALPQLVMDESGVKVDPQKLGKYLESGAAGLSAFEAEEDPDTVEVNREHAMFEVYDPTNPETTNELPALGVWQNHAIHLKLHFEFMKRSRARFDRWNPAAQQAFLDHLKFTTMAMQEIVNQTMPAPAPDAAGDGADEPVEPGAEDAPAGPQAVPSGKRLQLKRPGGQLQLTRGDRAAAGQ